METKQFKAHTRQIARDLRDKLLPQLRVKWSEAICVKLASLEQVRQAKTIALFRPIHKEPDIEPLFRLLWTQGKRLVAPKVISASEMKMFAIQNLKDDFVMGTLGIMEPKANCPEIPASELDLVVLPGVAFDTRGNRLGWGKGYYDRYLNCEGCNAYKVGVAYLFQVLDQLPTEAHDIRLDALVTPDRVLTFDSTDRIGYTATVS